MKLKWMIQRILDKKVIAFSTLEESNLMRKIHITYRNETEVDDTRNITQEKFYFYACLMRCLFKFSSSMELLHLLEYLFFSN